MSDTELDHVNHPFETTHWSDIRKAQEGSQEQKSECVNRLVSRYWKPVFCYIRCKGYPLDEAEDLTQGFFHEIVLGNELIRRAEQTKGRFRTFLLKALNHYLAMEHRKHTAQKRCPEGGLVPLDLEALERLGRFHEDVKPEYVYDYAWATGVLDHVMETLAREYSGTGRDNHWRLFLAKVVNPLFDSAREPSLAELCGKYGIETEKQASNMILTVRRRFASVLKRTLRPQVQSEGQIDLEIKEFIEILSTRGHTIQETDI